MTTTAPAPVEPTILNYAVPSLFKEVCTSCSGGAVVSAAHVAVKVDNPSVYVFFCGSHARSLSESMKAKGWAIHPDATPYRLR